MTVLLYHHVGPPRPGAPISLTVSPERFKQQIRWLARFGYVAPTATEWIAMRGQGPALPRMILITFDDGYADLARYAFPVLEQYGMHATTFTVTGHLARGDARMNGLPHPLLSAGEMRDWSARGIEFGAHSRTHAALPPLSADVLAAEVLGSQSDLEVAVNRPVRAFAYPFGYYDSRALEIVRKNFDVAFTVHEGTNRASADPHLVRRTMVQWNDRLVDVASRALFGFSPWQRLRATVAAVRKRRMS